MGFTDEQIAVRLIAVDFDKDEQWAERIDPVFPSWKDQPHNGESDGMDPDCERCLYEDYMDMAAAVRRLLRIPRSG